MATISNDEIYQNTEIIMQYRRNEEQPRNVLRPQCLGQENQEMFYENRNSMHLPATFQSPDERETYEVLDEKSRPAFYEALNTYDEKNLQTSANNSSTFVVTAKQHNVLLEENITGTSEVKNCVYDDVKQDSAEMFSHLNTGQENRTAASACVEELEMRDLKDEKDMIFSGTQNERKLEWCMYLIPLSLIIGIAALLIGILMIVGLIKTNDCTCIHEIRKLKTEIASLRIQFATSAFSSTYSSLKVTPSHQSLSTAPSQIPSSSFSHLSSSFSISISSISHLTPYASNQSLSLSTL